MEPDVAKTQEPPVKFGETFVEGTYYLQFDDKAPVKLAHGDQPLQLKLDPVDGSYIDFFDHDNSLKMRLFFRKEEEVKKAE